MSVRWSTNGSYRGYGVWGETVTNDTFLKEVDVRELTQEIPKLSEGTSEEDPYVFLILSVRWRFTLNLISAVDENIPVYYAPLQIRKLGRYTTSAYFYTSHTDFWSHNQYISPRFTFRARYFNLNLSLELDSSEPQIDAPDIFFENGMYYPWSGLYSVYQGFYDIIANSLTLYAEPWVTQYQLGITYDWDWEGWNSERIENEGGVPNIYIL